MTIIELRKQHPLTLPPYLFILDVEAVGLHGEGYSPGWMVIDTMTAKEVDSGCLAVDPSICIGDQEDRNWIADNVPAIPVTHMDRDGMLTDFWVAWLQWRARGAWMAADCASPVETRFIAEALALHLPGSRWDGPYPLIDVASVLLTHGIDPLATLPRLDNELPKHHPTNDARQSARYLWLCLKAQPARITLEDLEQILKGGKEMDIEIKPDGSIHAVPKGTANNATVMKVPLEAVINSSY